MRSFKNLSSLMKDFLNIKNVMQFHFKLRNWLMLIREKHSQGEQYCFCDKCRKYSLSFLIGFLFPSCIRRYAFCRLRHFLYKRKVIDNMYAAEFLQRYSQNLNKLKQFAAAIWRCFKECFLIEHYSLDFFNDEQVWFSREWNTGQQSSLPLREIIQYDKYLIKLNGPQRYFKFT